MGRIVNTELIVVNADTRRPVIDIDPLTVPTAGTWWVRSDVAGVVGLVRAARAYAWETKIPTDIVWSGNVDRSFESACGCHTFARLVDMIPTDDDRLACAVCR